MLTAAVDLFGERGYEGVGIAELLERSAAPRGSLYFHFPGGKEQIGIEVVGRVGNAVAGRFRGLHESGVGIDEFIERVFKTTARECKERAYSASCPIAAIATGFGEGNPKLGAAVGEAFSLWEREIAVAAEARGMSAKNAATFASAMLVAIEGALVASKAQRSAAPHVNASRAMQAFAAALIPT